VKIVVALIVVTILAGCTYVEPPDYDAELSHAFSNGAVGACLLTMATITGDIPQEHWHDALVMCEAVAERAHELALRIPVPRLAPEAVPYETGDPL